MVSCLKLVIIIVSECLVCNYNDRCLVLVYLIMIKVADEAIRRNYLKEGLGWISENLRLITE